MSKFKHNFALLLAVMHMSLLLQIGTWRFVKTQKTKNRDEHFYNVQFLVKEQAIPHHRLHGTASIKALSSIHKNNICYG